jgi:hypothetical protein
MVQWEMTIVYHSGTSRVRWEGERPREPFNYAYRNHAIHPNWLSVWYFEAGHLVCSA